MGTSNSNKGTGGKGTPLIPSWLESAGTAPGAPTTGSGTGSGGSVPQATSTPQMRLPIPPAASADRYRAARANFTSFARSGGTKGGSLGRAVSSYVTRSSGGARGAARGMGSSRAAGTRLLRFLSDTADRGIQEALKSLDLEELAGRPIDEIFLGLVDHICPEGGTTDTAIARAAFIETIAELAANGVTDLNALNIDQIQTVFELYATRTIEARLYNEIGNNAIKIPLDAAAALRVQTQLHDFVRNGVADALTGMRDRLERLTPGRVAQFVDRVYEQAFTVLVALGNAAQD